MDNRKIIREKQFDLSLQIKSNNFLKIESSQKNWTLVRTMEELADDLNHLDSLSKRFVTGSERKDIVENWAKSQAQYNDTQLCIDGQQVMQDWERPYMEAMWPKS
jgi:guanidinoacetate N-methyltransferase